MCASPAELPPFENAWRIVEEDTQQLKDLHPEKMDKYLTSKN